MIKQLLLLCFIFKLLALQSCSEPVGCIDSKAVNYDPNASLASNDCNYPTLSIVFDLKLGNLPFEINRIYNVNGYNTAFKEFQFYLSKVQLIRPDQSKIEFNSLYPLIKQSAPSFTLGSSFLETYERLQFNVGVDPSANALISTYLNQAGHPLFLQSPDTMHFNNNEGYIFLKMIGKVDRNGDGIPNENEAFDFRIGSDPLLQAIDLVINKTLSTAQETIRLEIDIEMLLDGVDLQTARKTHTSDNLPLASKIANNIPNAIRVP